LGLLTGMIQAYIFAILATVYISSATAEKEPSALNKEHTTSPKQTQPSSPNEEKS
jgi:F-type H+-transporting ATPase subunit a